MRPTTKRLARIGGLGVAGLAIVGALLWFLLTDAESQGPRIKGKPVAYWTRQLRAGQVDPDALSALANEKGAAIPALVKQLSLPDSAAKDFVKRLWRRLPAAMRARVPEPTTRAELRTGAAFALVVIYTNDFGPAPSLSEAQMILPALTKALQDRDVAVRLYAATALGHLGVISTQAIESCDVALKDTHWLVRANAVVSLGRLAWSDERAILHIKSALADSHPGVRKRATEQFELPGFPLHQYDPSSATEAK